MSVTHTPTAPPFCPNPHCPFHCGPTLSWRWSRAGHFRRQAAPHRIQRYRCGHCGRYFSEQTFRTTYWLKRPGLLLDLFHQLVQCSAFRQIARQHHASPQTIALQAARLGRHCQLFHELHRPKGPVREPLVLDSFQSFEYSQYHPTLFHFVVGRDSHFFHGFTESEMRRSGSMRAAQKERRSELEAALGRPDPRSVRREVAGVLRIVAPEPQALVLHTDEHQDYPRAIADVPHLRVDHRTVSSRAARTSRNPLFPANLLDLLVRHCGSDHKRETVAFAKRRQSAVWRLWVFLVWRNYWKWFSERRPGATPAMRAGVCEHRIGLERILAQRLFPTRVELPERWAEYYWGRVPTRRVANGRRHELTYAC
jgi:transposase-like protein